MARAEIALLWVTIFGYVGSFCLQLLGFLRQHDRSLALARRALYMALGVHTVTVAVRWKVGGHMPVTDGYELNLVGTWLTVLFFLAFDMVRKMDRSYGLVVTPIVFLVLGHGLMSWSEARPMGPAFRSPWLIIHVLFAWIAFAGFAVAAAAAMLLLLKGRRPGWGPMARIPSLEALDLASYRFIVLGVVTHTVMLISGSIWARNLWGHYWSWDPLETWSLLTFLLYIFYLHARAFLGWKLERAAWLAAFGLIVLSISFWGVEWFAPSLHPGP